MSFLPSMFSGTTFENVLRFRSLNTHIRTWVRRSRSGPAHNEDYHAILSFISGKRALIDAQPLMDTAEMLAKEFPRICVVEVVNGSGTDGVILRR